MDQKTRLGDINRTVTMRSLGRLGRAGNQFFQYLFLKVYCNRDNLNLQLPNWVGNYLFGFSDLKIKYRKLPRYKEGRVDKNGQGIPPGSGQLAGKDFYGFAQYHTRYYSPHKELVLKMFTPIPEVENRLKGAVDRMHETGRTIIGVHVRRGDYGLSQFPIIPTSWYLEWLNNNRLRFYSPEIFLATDNVGVSTDFDRYRIHTSTSLGVPLSSKPMDGYNYLPRELQLGESAVLDWYPDFYLLSQCDVILAPSSTFSFFAAMLNRRLTEYWRASLAAEGFVLTDPWNSYPLLREYIRDYPHLEGISVESNPYW